MSPPPPQRRMPPGVCKDADDSLHASVLCYGDPGTAGVPTAQLPSYADYFCFRKMQGSPVNVFCVPYDFSESRFVSSSVHHCRNVVQNAYSTRNIWESTVHVLGKTSAYRRLLAVGGWECEKLQVDFQWRWGSAL